MGEMVMCHGEGNARVVDGDGHRFHLYPHRFESGDVWGVIGGLLLKPLVTSEVLAKSDLDED